MSENPIIAVAARWLTPLAALFSLTLLANWPAGAGVGFVSGAALALCLVLNALIFGVSSMLRAMPASALRATLALALVLTFVSAGVPNWRWSAFMIELGAFFATASAISLVSLAVMGRVAALRENSWR